MRVKMCININIIFYYIYINTNYIGIPNKSRYHAKVRFMFKNDL